MENASKALIIAGAILLAIAIIGVGMYVFNNAQESVQGTDMTEEEVAAYNGDFDVYAGSVRGSRAKTLIDTVNNHNLTASDDSNKIQVVMGTGNATVNVQDIDEDQTTTGYLTGEECKGDILDASTYDISFGYDSRSGKITTIYIDEDDGRGGYY